MGIGCEDIWSVEGKHPAISDVNQSIEARKIDVWDRVRGGHLDEADMRLPGLPVGAARFGYKALEEMKGVETKAEAVGCIETCAPGSPRTYVGEGTSLLRKVGLGDGIQVSPKGGL